MSSLPARILVVIDGDGCNRIGHRYCNKNASPPPEYEDDADTGGTLGPTTVEQQPDDHWLITENGTQPTHQPMTYLSLDPASSPVDLWYLPTDPNDDCRYGYVQYAPLPDQITIQKIPALRKKNERRPTTEKV